TAVCRIGSITRTESCHPCHLEIDEESRLDVGGVFIYVGFTPNSQIFGDDFAKDDQGFLITDDKMETHIPGLYVCGDVRSQYVRQISYAVFCLKKKKDAATRYIKEVAATREPRTSDTAERVP